MKKLNEFYDLGSFSVDEINHLLEQSRRLENSPDPRLLEGKVLAMLFLNPSLRTLTSFQATMSRLGGGTFVISPEMSIHGLETKQGIVMDGNAAEHINEAVPAIASYADVIGIRALSRCENLEDDLADKEFKEIRALCDIPVVNMESAIHHPCQSLADWRTLDDLNVPKNGGKLVFSWVYHPEALPLTVLGDTVHMAAMRGMDVTVLRPEGFELPDQIMSRAKSAAKLSGGSVEETDNRQEALDGANIIYARSWSSTSEYGSRRKDRDLRNELEDWCVDKSWISKAHTDCKLMHCLPVRRGVEVDDEVLDSDSSAVTLQARNRMYTQMAILKHLLLN